MSWAQQRQYLIISIIVVVLVILVGGLSFLFLHKPASCVDGKLNQKEEGIDCGGPCPYACTVSESAPIVKFVQTVHPEQGRTDVIAYVSNANINAGVAHAQYFLTVYDSNEALVAQATGTIALPPSTTAPLYIPNIYSGYDGVAQAFLTISTSSLNYLRTIRKPIQPIPGNIVIGQGDHPRITATIQNPTATPLYNEVIVATVFDAEGNAIGASQTVAPELPAQGTTNLVFTWNQAFSAPVARVELLPATGS